MIMVQALKVKTHFRPIVKLGKLFFIILVPDQLWALDEVQTLVLFESSCN